MIALVTGSSGFIGSALIKKLLNDSRIISVVGLSRKGNKNFTEKKYVDIKADILDDIEEVIEYTSPDIVFHCAANPLTNQKPLELTRTNVLGTHNLISSLPNPCRFIFLSSATVYGSGDLGRKSIESDPLDTGSFYGASKVSGESIVNAATKLGVLSSLITFRPVAIVGPGATHGVVPDVVRKLRDQTLSKLELLGESPGSTKQYTHIDDLVDIVIKLGLDKSFVGAYNIAPDDHANIHQLAYTVMQKVGINKEIDWLGAAANWRGDNRYINLSNTKLKAAGWTPKYNRSLDAIRNSI
jgi:nucleoside-diphosphate-sugar epimerase